MLIVDFETKSRCNLLTKGQYNYAQDPSTDILCAAFTHSDPDDTREWLWTPADGDLPKDLINEINETDFIAAHNAPFDRAIWEFVAVEEYDFPEIEFDRWYCTSAQCRVNNLPASLEDAARALNSKHQKDHKGKALIRKLSIPQADGTFCDDPALLEEMAAYCLQDVKTTKGVVNATRVMTQTEHADWLNNEEINERGVLIDTALAEAAQLYANDEYIEIAERLHEASHGAITKHTQTVRAANWIVEELGETHPIVGYMTKYKDGEPKISIDKQARGDIIDAVELEELDVPDAVLDVIVALNEGSASSVTKFKNMALRADEETERVQGAFIYAGASQTLRFASRGLQMHNLPSRGLFETTEEADDVMRKMLAGQDIPTPVMLTLKKMLRHAIKAAPGKSLIIGDWSGIEARTLPWIADTEQALEKLTLIASGADIYEITAERIGFEGNRPLGKVCELALGYEGGLGAFKQFAKIYNVVIGEGAIKPIIEQWRKTNAWVVMFWRDLEKAAMRAVRNEGEIFNAGRIRYMYSSALMDGSLLCILPDDSVLTYPRVRIERRKGHAQLTALKASVKMKADAKEWPRESLYGGRLAGHANQGTAGSLLRDLIDRVDNCVAHVHDEVILEVPTSRADAERVRLQDEMLDAPPWAVGLPLKATPEIAERYKK